MHSARARAARHTGRGSATGSGGTQGRLEGERIDDQREATGEVIAGTAVEPHLCAVLAGNDAEAVVLDLMQPLAAGRQLVGFGWETRRDDSGRQGTLQHVDKNKGGQWFQSNSNYCFGYKSSNTCFVTEPS